MLDKFNNDYIVMRNEDLKKNKFLKNCVTGWGYRMKTSLPSQRGEEWFGEEIVCH